MADMDRDFLRLARIDPSELEKETGGDEEVGLGEAYESAAGEGAESTVNREARAEAPATSRGYRRLDEPRS